MYFRCSTTGHVEYDSLSPLLTIIKWVTSSLLSRWVRKYSPLMLIYGIDLHISSIEQLIEYIKVKYVELTCGYQLDLYNKRHI